MEDLIKRSDVIKVIEEIETERLRGQINLTYAPTIKRVNDLPSADRPSGEWIDADGNFVPLNNHGITTDSCRCSECGEWLVASDEYPTIGKFCPNCGAYMRGEHDD